jgi:hypothetical protein
MRFRTEALPGIARSVVRYDFVHLTDAPDELRGAQIGELRVGDEVEIIERRGAWLYVKTPLDAEGWLHRTTIDRPEESSAPSPTAVTDRAAAERTGSGPSLDTLLADIVANRQPPASGAQSAS